MKRELLRLPAIVMLSALALASCKLNLFTLSSAVTFSVQNPYSSTPISIGYAIPSDGNIFNSGGSVVTDVTLAKKVAGTFMPLQQYTSTSGSSGTLSFDLNQILQGNSPGIGVAGSYLPASGTYLISMQVLSGGKPLPGYYGQQAFTVDTSGGSPTITEVTPGIWSAPSSVPIPVVISGYHFPPGATLAATVTPTGNGSVAVASPVVKSSTEIDAQVTASSLSTSPPGTEILFTVTDPNTGSSSTFPVVASAAAISFAASPAPTVPSSAAGAGNANQIILLYGNNFTPFTTVTMTDARGTSIPVLANVLQGQVVTNSTTTPTVSYPLVLSGMIPIYANLSGAAAGNATITVTNPDGSSAIAGFTIN